LINFFYDNDEFCFFYACDEDADSNRYEINDADEDADCTVPDSICFRSDCECSRTDSGGDDGDSVFDIGDINFYR
jgi:hypothetical protein